MKSYIKIAIIKKEGRMWMRYEMVSNQIALPILY